MKLSLNLEAESISVLALNMGRIAVEVEGVELAELLNVINNNGYTLTIANEPGEIIIADPLPATAKIAGIQCSTAHISPEDNAILDQVSLQHHDGSNSDWILYTGYGYLLRLNARLYPVLELKRLGLSKTCRRLVVTLMRRYSTDIIHFDASGELLPGFAAFDW